VKAAEADLNASSAATLGTWSTFKPYDSWTADRRNDGGRRGCRVDCPHRCGLSANINTYWGHRQRYKSVARGFATRLEQFAIVSVSGEFIFNRR